MGTTGGVPQGVYVVSDAEIASGAFRVAPGKAIRVTGMAPTTRGVLGGDLVPVYVISDPSVRGVEGGVSIPMSNLTGIRAPEKGLAIPIYVISDDGQFASPSCQSALCQSLVGYWAMDEASGLPLNSVNTAITFDATVGSDPTSVAGKVGTARHFDGSNQFTASDNLFSLVNTLTQDFSVAFWAKHGSPGFAGGPISVDGGGGASRSWSIFLSGGSYNFQMYDGPISGPNASMAYVNNAWNLCMIRFDHTTQKPSISVNGSSWAASVSTMTGAMQTNAGWPLRLGNAQLNAYTGDVDEVVYLIDHLWTDAERDFLWNGGVGRSWADVHGYTG